jgi:hypothetical protein
MSKTLHLYEARYISLLENVMERDDKMFIHTVVVSPWEQGTDRPVPTPGAFLGQDFALCYNTLVQVRAHPSVWSFLCRTPSFQLV